MKNNDKTKKDLKQLRKIKRGQNPFKREKGESLFDTLEDDKQEENYEDNETDSSY